MLIQDIMKSAIHVDKDQRLSHAVELFGKHNIARLPVIEEGNLVGIITQRDIMKKIGYFKEDLKVSTFHVSTCMTREPITLQPSDPVKRAIEVFCEHGVSGIPIVEQELVGILTKLDVIEVHAYIKKVSECYAAEFIPISIDERVVHARMLMLENDERCLPVINGSLRGIITTSDVVFGLHKFMELVDRHQGTLVRNLSVMESMNQNPVTATLDQDVEDVKTVMVRENLSTLPVLDKSGAVIGLISKDQMIRSLCDEYAISIS
jgi:CBS domain-containing protein